MASKIVVSRKAEWMNRRRNFKVFIDGKEVGVIKNGSTEEFEVAPGDHEVQCKVDWCSSPEFSLHVADNAVEFLQVSSALKYYFPLYIIMLFGIAAPLLFKLTHTPKPDWLGIAQITFIIPGLLYLVYYLTFNRKNYLVVAKDTSNPFRK